MTTALETMLRIVNRPETWDFNGCGRVFCGVDIGTHSVVAVLVNELGRPLAAKMRLAQVVRSGLIVDYLGALEIVRELVGQLRERCPLELGPAATTYPPNTESGNIRTTTHILEAAELEVIQVLDEPSAANLVLNLDQGCIVDVGGGTTGIAVIRDGAVVYSGDEATGGVHLSLVLAGGMGLDLEEAEKIKADKSRAREVMGLVRPVIDKISAIVEQHLKPWPGVETIHLVGGTCELEGLDRIMAENLGRRVERPLFPQAVTPLGVALSCLDKAGNRAGLRLAAG